MGHIPKITSPHDINLTMKKIERILPQFRIPPQVKHNADILRKISELISKIYDNKLIEAVLNDIPKEAKFHDNRHINNILRETRI